MAATTESFWEPTPPSVPSIPTTDDSTESLPTMTALDDTPSSNIPVVESTVALDSSNDNDDPSSNSCSLQESWNAKIMIPEDPPAPHIPPVGTEPPEEGSTTTPHSNQMQMQLQHQQPPQPFYPYYPPPPMMAPPPPSDPSSYFTGAASNPYFYQDVANVQDPIPDTRRNRGGVTEPFPNKLHRMLEYAAQQGMTDVVSFFPHGRAFCIHKPRPFVSHIMPLFFKQSKLTSFQRQLNLYGFRRISQGPDNGGYYHELFLRGRPGLCVNMKRTKVKGLLKLKRDPETEPDFYSMPPLPPPETSASSPSATRTNILLPNTPLVASGGSNNNNHNNNTNSNPNTPPSNQPVLVPPYPPPAFYPFTPQMPQVPTGIPPGMMVPPQAGGGMVPPPPQHHYHPYYPYPTPPPPGAWYPTATPQQQMAAMAAVAAAANGGYPMNNNNTHNSNMPSIVMNTNTDSTVPSSSPYMNRSDPNGTGTLENANENNEKNGADDDDDDDDEDNVDKVTALETV